MGGGVGAAGAEIGAAMTDALAAIVDAGGGGATSTTDAAGGGVIVKGVRGAADSDAAGLGGDGACGADHGVSSSVCEGSHMCRSFRGIELLAIPLPLHIG